MKTSKIGVWFVSGALAASMGVALVGCGGGEQKQVETTPATTEEKTEQVEAPKQTEKTEKTDTRQVLGKESATTIEVALTNGLDSDLTAVKMRATGESAYPASLVESGKTIAAKEEVRLFVEADAKGTFAETYDIMVTKKGKDGKTTDVEFVAVPLADIASAKLIEKDGIAYVEYKTAEGKTDSTKKAAEAAAAATAAASTADQSQGTQTSKQNATDETGTAADTTGASGMDDETTPDDAAYGDYSDTGYYEEDAGNYDSSASDYSEAPAEAPAESTSAPAQTGDACTGDVEFR
jgi:hypothetical protein